MLRWNTEDAEIKIAVFLFVVAAFCRRCHFSFVLFCFVFDVLFPRLSVISAPCAAVLQPNPTRFTGYSVMEQRPVRSAALNA